MVSKPYPGLRSACVWQQTRHTIIIPANNKEPSTYHFILYLPLLWLIDLPASISLFLLLDNGLPLFLHHRAWLLFHREYYRDNRASGGIHQVLFLLVVLNLPDHPTDKFVN